MHARNYLHAKTLCRPWFLTNQTQADFGKKKQNGRIGSRSSSSGKMEERARESLHVLGQGHLHFGIPQGIVKQALKKPNKIRGQEAQTEAQNHHLCHHAALHKAQHAFRPTKLTDDRDESKSNAGLSGQRFRKAIKNLQVLFDALCLA